MFAFRVKLQALIWLDVPIPYIYIYISDLEFGCFLAFCLLSSSLKFKSTSRNRRQMHLLLLVEVLRLRSCSSGPWAFPLEMVFTLLWVLDFLPQSFIWKKNISSKRISSWLGIVLLIIKRRPLSRKWTSFLDGPPSLVFLLVHNDVNRDVPNYGNKICSFYSLSFSSSFLHCSSSDSMDQKSSLGYGVIVFF